MYDVHGLTVTIDAHHVTVDEKGTKGLFQQLDLAGATPNWRPGLVAD
ncbi:hypothetical protein RMN56_11155 [Micromonospora halotolerans]|uniref:Uncharacterized protein n=1 Tax=Micromonospora halotolerans TaxID=709879 RepID=A0ABZ0A2U0_9ACTN|nr:hypothetical protein [Micromonospora halotolerans]WNM41854.1 hypothetical protein RMN56_11155 [Micromonospora halotolerans]